jgi:hypothetical protein
MQPAFVAVLDYGPRLAALSQLRWGRQLCEGVQRSNAPAHPIHCSPANGVCMVRGRSVTLSSWCSRLIACEAPFDLIYA